MRGLKPSRYTKAENAFVPHVIIAGRWERNPEFTATRRVAYARRQYEVAFGAGRLQTQTRLLADFRVRIP
jgi:hypothetical protein